ncbi:MAG TPA: DUF4349 domain-containing protein [Acidimicrobiales bacterium]|nr:DUF4349 domain-containing protein [Acidimicrobiales bacterium]
MIEEGLLTSALRDAADVFDVSEGAVERILEVARNAEDRAPSRAVQFARHPHRGRTLLAAVAVVAALGGIALPLMNKGTAPLHAFGGLPPLTGRATSSHGAPKFDASTSPNSTQSSASGNEGLAVTGTGFAPNAAAGTVGPRIESSGSITLRVKGTGVETSFARLSALAAKDGGSVSSSQARFANRSTGHFAYGTIVLRVPQGRFGALVTQVQRVGHATSLTTSSNDVTSQYVDLRARISAQEASRRQYLAIMSRAGSISAVLAVQRQLDTIQSQIEQLQGQLNVLDNQTTYGLLSVHVTTAASVPLVVRHRSGLAKAWHDAVAGFVAGFEWLVRLSGPLVFAVLLLGALLLAAWAVRRALRHRRT